MSFDPQAEVSVDGEWVTVRFKVPFRRGDEFIHPRMLKHEVVDLAPAVTIGLGRTFTEQELAISEVSMGGAWYTASHTQLHGIKEFTRAPNDVINYWSSQSFSDLRGMMSSLRRFAANDKVLSDRLEELFAAKRAAAVAKAKDVMATEILKTMETIKQLEGDA